ncbi:MAG: sigma-54 dependent transcriptional regulator [Methylococcaceae bacterium]|nr:sigma-54 dependent transcriptional regulator [Methylococcaceae bacterium]
MSICINKKIKMIGQSAKFQEILRTAGLVAMTDVPVLISGEIGTGKKQLALSIHQQSNRCQRPFVSVNCSSLSKENIEATLFGSIKTELTEKVQGYIFQARLGTLLLKNIEVLPESLQTKLLHFIETGDVYATGSTKSKKYDVRLIVTTQKNLKDEMLVGNFHSDLYYRLNVVPIELPSLEERKGDINLLMDYFFRQFVAEQHRPMPVFSKATIAQINRYNWIGNIRELHSFCERMFILFSGKQVEITNLPEEIRLYKASCSTSKNSQSFFLPETGIRLDEVEVDLIRQALQNTNGNKSRAARLLGLTRDTFLYRLKKYSISA